MGIFDKLKQASSLLQSVTPRDLSLTSLAFDHYRQHGALLITDSLLEEHIAPKLERHEKIQHVALFGFGDHLKLLIEATILHQSVHLLFQVKPMEIVWTDERHQMIFSYTFERFEMPKKAVEISMELITDFIADAIPFGNIINAIAGISMGQAIRSTGLAMIQSLHSDQEHGIKLENGKAFVDLEKQTILEPLWQRPDLSRFAAAQALLGERNVPNVAALMQPKKFWADRHGVHIAIGLNDFAMKVFAWVSGNRDEGAQ